MEKRKICVVTGTRAEYGLLYWLMKEIESDEQLELQIVVTGMHLSPEFGLTYRTIEADGFNINKKVEMLLSSDTGVSIAKSIGLGCISLADALVELNPDIMVLLGDRFEAFAAATVAMSLRIPIAHIHGGEATEGLIDEAIRHSITKMSHLHFVTAEPYRKRVIQLGEQPDRVFNFGAPGLDYVKNIDLLPRAEFEEAIGFRLGAVNFLITYHPVTLSDQDPAQAATALLTALDQFPQAHLIFTKANADTNGRIINEMFEAYVAAHPGRAALFASLGQLRYFSAIEHVDVVIGNSSSGIIEVPFFAKPTVNLGPRQQGRMKARSVLDCAENENDIVRAIQTALSAEFRGTLRAGDSLYGQGNTAAQIKNELKRTSLEGILMKPFYDLGET